MITYCTSILLGGFQVGADSTFIPMDADSLAVARLMLDRYQLAVSILGFGGTITALGFGLWRYTRAERWRRLEFVAQEVKEFEAHPVVRTALQMLDWGVRHINLHQKQEPARDDLIRISRETQWRALLPHAVTAAEIPLTDGAPPSRNKRTFTRTEAKVRDTYDVLLDHLDRFGAFIESGLVSAKEFAPFIRYWIDDMAAINGSKHDARWRCALLTYIQFYRFHGVVSLFAALGHDVRHDKPLFAALADRAAHADLIAALRQALERPEADTEGDMVSRNDA